MGDVVVVLTAVLCAGVLGVLVLLVPIVMWLVLGVAVGCVCGVAGVALARREIRGRDAK